MAAVKRRGSRRRPAVERERAVVAEAPSGRKIEPWAAPLLLALATFATFFQVTHQSFLTWDDRAHVVDNPYFIRLSTANLAHFWTHSFEHLYIPISYMAFAMLTVIARGHVASQSSDTWNSVFDPHVFHTANLVLHSVNSLIVYAILHRITRKPWPSLFGALLFAVHPLQVESVAWISELRGLLSAMFSLGAVYAYLTATDGPKSASPMQWWTYWVALLFSALALLSKPSAVALPFVLFALDRWVTGRTLQACAVSVAPWLLLTVVFVVITRGVQQVSPQDTSIPWQRPFIAGDALAFYLGKLFAPVRLTIDYGRTPASLMSHPWAYFTCLAPIAVAILIGFFRKRAPWLVAAGLITLGNLIPVLGLLPFNFQHFSTVADRYIYLAMLGPALVVAMLLANAGTRAVLGYGVATAGLAAFTVLTVQQIPHWNDDLSLFDWATRMNPNSYAAHEDYGAALANVNRNSEAIAQYQAVVRLHGVDPAVFNDLGVATAAEGELDDAVSNYRNSIALAPNFFLPHRGLGVVLMHQGKLNDAADELNTAITLAPNDAYSHSIYGLILHMLHRLDDASAQFRQAIALAPDKYEGHLGLADVLFAQGHFPDAIVQYRLAEQFAPGYDAIHENLGRALMQTGDAADAVPELETAVKLKPSPASYDLLGIACQTVGDTAGARSAFESEASMDPNSPGAHHVAVMNGQAN